MIQLNRDHFDERFGLWAMAVLAGSVLGTVAHLVMVGRHYNINVAPIGAVGLVVTGALFSVLGRTTLARVGWGVVVAAALATVVAPVGALGRSGWWVQALAILVGGVLVALGAMRRRLHLSTAIVAAALLIASAVARVTSLRMFESILGTSTVLSGQ
ncbi:MAG: hypothetical protein U0P30_17680 [Vicinamibacterales bacterium]